jgi:Uma2 family endonuclease
MASITQPEQRPSEPPAPSLPPLENGDHLDQKTFHARYEAMPEGFRAELIGGIVFVPSPLKQPHGRMHPFVSHWLASYEDATAGVEVLDNATDILSEESEPQPDVLLRILSEHGGRTHVNAADYLEGPPELIAEVASSSESLDLHRKRRDYEQAGVGEYIVVALRQHRVFWFVLREGRYQDLASGSDGILRSESFPGLWLDPAALLRHDRERVREVLQQGLATPEHAAFVARLRGQ